LTKITGVAAEKEDHCAGGNRKVAFPKSLQKKGRKDSSVGKLGKERD